MVEMIGITLFVVIGLSIYSTWLSKENIRLSKENTKKKEESLALQELFNSCYLLQLEALRKGEEEYNKNQLFEGSGFFCYIDGMEKCIREIEKYCFEGGREE